MTATVFRQSYMTQCPSWFIPISYYAIVFSFALIFANGWFTACDGFMVLLLIGWVIWNNKPLPLCRQDRLQSKMQQFLANFRSRNRNDILKLFVEIHTLAHFFHVHDVCYTWCRVALLRHFLGLPGRWVLQKYWPFWQVTDLGCIHKRVSNGIGLSNNIFLKEHFLNNAFIFLFFSVKQKEMQEKKKKPWQYATKQQLRTQIYTQTIQNGVTKKSSI